MLSRFAVILNSTTFAFVTALHDGLNSQVIVVQSKLLANFQNVVTVVNSMRGKQRNSLDAQVDAILSSKAKKLEGDRKGLILTVHIWTQLQVRLVISLHPESRTPSRKCSKMT